jgi:hypothetical protein
MVESIEEAEEAAVYRVVDVSDSSLLSKGGYPFAVADFSSTYLEVALLLVIQFF